MGEQASGTVVERLWPGPWFWVLGLGGVVSLGVAYFVALGPLAGGLMTAASGLVLVVLGVRLAVPIEVESDGLRAGRARLPWQFAGRVIPLDGAAARVARGPQGDPTAWLLLRPGVGPGALVVEITDPDDPHATWLLATRNPQRLSRAIAAARGTLRP